MGDREVRAGENISLRARFRDDHQDPAPADSNQVYIHIFEAGVTDTGNLSNAIVVSGVPTLFGKGIYEYDYLVPSCGPDGTWHDVWEGTLNCQPLSGVFSFDVSASGVIEPLDCQINVNNIVNVTLVSGILPLDGAPGLSEEYEFEFMTTTSPSFTSLRYVRLQVGSFLGDLFEDTIQQSILEASLDAEAITFQTTITNQKVFNHARRQYTTCLASKILLNNVNNRLLRSKTLGDLSVSYDTNGIRDMLADLHDCMAKWEPQVMAGGGAKSSSQPRYVVKGECDPDRPIMSRSWVETEADPTPGGRIPAANRRVQFNGKRRAQRYFRKRWW